MSDEKINAVQAPDTWADILDDEERAVLELAELILVAGQANLNNRVGNAAKQLLGE